LFLIMREEMFKKMTTPPFVGGAFLVISVIINH